MCPCSVAREPKAEPRRRRRRYTVAEHGARYERRSVAVRRASVIVGTRESDVIGDGDEDSSGGGKG